MNAHTKLTMHHSRHMYKRGMYKGEAPADSARRAKRHFRVIKGNGGQMIVRFHNADILTAYEDGHIKLDTRGWDAHPTTRSAMNQALGFIEPMAYVGSHRMGGYSQTVIRMAGKTYRYYDGMEFSADGTPLTPLKEFTAKRTDREETAEFRREIKESGFVGMFPVLYAAAEVPVSSWMTRIKEKMCADYSANEWPEIVALAKYPSYHSRSRRRPHYENHKKALQAFVASFTKNMTKLVDTGVTVL